MANHPFNDVRPWKEQRGLLGTMHELVVDLFINQPIVKKARPPMMPFCVFPGEPGKTNRHEAKTFHQPEKGQLKTCCSGVF